MNERYIGKTRRSVNYLKTIYFDRPEWTHCAVSFLPATWMKHREELEDVVCRHPKLFPGFVKGSKDYDEIPFALYELGQHVDCWGCTWENISRGFDGAVEVSPLENWDAMDTWKIPDPMKDGFLGPMDWDAHAKRINGMRERGEVIHGGALPHGFMYMTLYYIRGFENFMMDMALDDPRLHKLIEIVTNYDVEITKKCLEYKPDIVGFGEDLSHQKALPMSPEMWRKFIKPSYERIMGICRDSNVPVFLHSDGNILDIIPDLIDVGVKALNPQFRANGLEGLKRVAKGRVSLDQDLDRQLFPFATGSMIEDHIKEVYDALYLPEGGLMLLAECAPDVPIENIETICNTLEKICNLPDPAYVDACAD